MQFFPQFEPLGFRAAITTLDDGDCAWRGCAESRSRALLKFGSSLDSLVQVRQVHGGVVVRAEAADRGRGAISVANALADADALVTKEGTVTLGISVADCVPLYLVDPVQRCAALIHAGREGTDVNIGANAVHFMAEQYGARPRDLRALIGPSAGPCCYQVSEAMAAEWLDAGWLAKGRFLDLWGTNAQQLETAGLMSENFTVVGHCTICTPGYHSYRRDASKARNLALLKIV